MAQTARATVPEEKETSSGSVYIPEPGLHVQTAASEEHPGGEVIHLTHGWVELPPELASNAVLKNLVPDPAREALDKMRREQADAAAKSASEHLSELVALDDAHNEDMRVAEIERGKRVDEEAASAISKEESPIDPDALRAFTLTAPNVNVNMRQMVSAAGMASKHPWESGGPEEVPPPSAPGNIDAPYVSGDGIVGATLSCTMGNWSGEPTLYSYQWKSDAVDVTGAESEYIIAASDAGKNITCVVTATNAMGSAVAPPSNAVAVANGAAATAAAHPPSRRTTV